MTRTSDRWQCLPGGFDALNALHLFPSDNPWGIPQMQPTPLTASPQWLAPYKTRIRSQAPLDGAAHFFLDDYRFEAVWNFPQRALAALRLWPAMLTPDFSLYRDWPLTLQLWNTYRNRWCGCYWQAAGLTVIPTVSWSTHASFDFCFQGIAPGSLVAVSTVGVWLHDPTEHHLFMAGFRELLTQVQPGRVLCYGPAPRAAHDLVEVWTYPTHWVGIKQARKEGPGLAVPARGTRAPAPTDFGGAGGRGAACGPHPARQLRGRD